MPNCDFFIERNHIDPRFSIFHQPKEISRILTHFPLSFQTGNNEQWRNCPKKSWVVSHPGVYLAASDVIYVNCQSIFFQSKPVNLSGQLYPNLSEQELWGASSKVFPWPRPFSVVKGGKFFSCYFSCNGALLWIEGVWMVKSLIISTGQGRGVSC